MFFLLFVFYLFYCFVYCLSFSIYSCPSPIPVPVYWQLPLFGNSIATNKTYIISYHIISYHIISYHTTSYHITSYHIISHHIISYHIISSNITLVSCSPEITDEVHDLWNVIQFTSTSAWYSLLNNPPSKFSHSPAHHSYLCCYVIMFNTYVRNLEVRLYQFSNSALDVVND